MALTVSQQQCTLREIVLRDKPADMLAASPKATVPVLQLPDGTVLEESFDIMLWALGRNDPESWLSPEVGTRADMQALIVESDGPFKQHLDRYKYAIRYEAGTDPLHHRTEGSAFLDRLNDRLAHHGQLFGDRTALADVAIFPFVRQFANTDRDWFDGQSVPNLQRWLAGHLDSALFKSVMVKWPVWQPGDAETVFPNF